MNELRALLSLELRSLYGINRFLHTKDKKEKNRYRLLIGAWIILIAMAFSYVGLLVYGLCMGGLGGVVPAYLAVLSSMLILAFGIFTAGSRIFGQKGYDILAALPVKSGSIVLARFLTMYVEDLILTLVILLPGIAVYGFCLQPRIGFYWTAAVGAVCIPAIPLVLSTLLGTLVLAISSRMKRKSMVQTVLMVAFVLVVVLGSFGAGPLLENMTPEAFAQLAQVVAGAFARLYPPAMWLNAAMLGTNYWGLLLFAAVSLAVMAGAIWVAAKNFPRIQHHLQTFAARHDYQIGAMESRGLLKALYIREAKRYFSSSIYVTNTIIGPILGAVMAIGLCVTGLDSLRQQLPVDIPSLLPFLVAGVFCIMTTSCTSISMEGKSFWVIKSLPIPTKPLLDSKILLNLSLMLPFYVVSLIAMAMATRPDALEFLWLGLIPAVIMVFSVVFGITVNLKLHSFDWEKEEAVVKQSAPAALGGFAGFFLAVGSGAAVMLTPTAYGNLVRAALCLVLAGLTWLLYQHNNKAVLSRL